MTDTSCLPREITLKSGHHGLIREATAHDARDVLEYILRVCAETDFLSFGPGEFTLTEKEEAEILQRYLDAENQCYLLATIEGKIVGSLIFAAGNRSRLRHSGELSMSVLKDFWGSGFGSQLLDVLLEWAIETGVITKINLRVRTDNERAITLYERKGFIREGTMRNEILIDGRYYDHHLMGRILS